MTARSRRPAAASPPGDRRVPLARALSKLGAASRSSAISLIAAGRVTVDGRVARDPLARVAIDRVAVAVDGRPIARSTVRRLIAFHKPRGVVTTRRDPQGRRTVFDVLGDAAAGLVAVGRLDAASTGLLLFTSDTSLADRLTDPRSHLTRRYVVTVRGCVSEEVVRRIERGIEVVLDRGRRERLHASRVDVRKRSRRETHLVVELTEGKNREIRRLFAAVGHEVTRLLRVAFGPYELGDLAPGEWTPID